MSKTLYIIRGCSGSGKSTFATTLASSLEFVEPGSTEQIEADQFWYLQERVGIYSFDINRREEAHEWCQNKVKRAIRRGVCNIIISNTTTSDEELNIYLDMAKEFGYSVVSLVVENRHGNVNIHDVPQYKLKEQEMNIFSSLKLLP